MNNQYKNHVLNVLFLHSENVILATNTINYNHNETIISERTAQKMV